MINKVIIWGLKNSWHTHSHIHKAFYRAFVYLKYETYWINKKEEYNGEISNALILYSGVLGDRNIEPPPVIDSCFYLLHNCSVDTKNYLKFQVYTTDCIGRDKGRDLKYHYNNDDTLYFYWGTNLLPNEIEENIKNIELINNDKNENCCHVGSLSGPWTKPWTLLANYFKEYEIGFSHYHNLSDIEHINVIQNSLFAPAVQFKWQVDKEYIPCRIFKNISYGKMGITNNKAVNNIFDNELIYDTDLKKLAKKCIIFDKLPKKLKIEKIVKLMNIVKEKHTYVSKINYILDFLIKEKNIEIKKK